MEPLPLDFYRCDPAKPDSFCRGCRRWSDHPQQTSTESTKYIYVEGSASNDCRYIPVVEDGIS